MQAISTRYLKPTNTKGARIVASCSAAQKIYDYYDLIEKAGTQGRIIKSADDSAHIEAAKQLKLHLAQVKGLTHWDKPTIAGCIWRTGEYAHVYIED